MTHYISTTFAAAAMLFGAASVQAQAATSANSSDVCTTRLTEITNAWNAAGFVMPTKPSQALVPGNNGLFISGAEATYVRGQLHFATSNCAHGDTDKAAANLDHVQSALNQIHGTGLGDQ